MFSALFLTAVSVFLLVVAAVLIVFPFKSWSRPMGVILAFLGVVVFGSSIFVVVPASTVGVVTTFGKVGDNILLEGGHFISPFSEVHKVYTGMDTASALKSEAASRDLQTVHSDLTLNFHVEPGKARDLFVLTPSLQYAQDFVVPAMYEVFKSVVAQYTAEELVTKRQEVSAGITKALNQRLAQYHLQVQTVNLVNFGFSKSFNSAIEEKVTASQKAETAKRNLEKVKFEAEARIAQAEGEAKAISIQAAATEKSGGAAYIQLQAIDKWDGKLPQYMGGNAPMPFINVK